MHCFWMPAANQKKDEFDDGDDALPRLWTFLTSAALIARNRLCYHPCDGTQHPRASGDSFDRHGPPCFWLCSPCLECDQRQLDCLADTGCGEYDENYGSHGPHLLSACPFTDLDENQYAASRANAKLGYVCHYSQQELEFARSYSSQSKDFQGHGVFQRHGKRPFGDLIEEIVVHDCA